MEKMPEFPVPKSLVETLRPYQKTGYIWLRFLMKIISGPVWPTIWALARPSKTITFLQSIYSKINSVLIVCPVTIILNWKKEFKKFSDMDIHIYHVKTGNFQKSQKLSSLLTVL